MDIDIPATLVRLGGIATTQQLLCEGATTRSLRQAVADGVILRARRGSYMIPGMPLAVVRASQLGGKLAAGTAAASYGLWLLRDRDRRPHVWIPASASRLPATRDVRVHRDAAWSGDERFRVSILHCLRQMAEPGRRDEFFVALESALDKGLIAMADRERLVEVLPSYWRQYIMFAHDGSQSGLESLTRLRLRDAGITAVSQVIVAGVGRVDLLIGTSLIIEVDGVSTHDFHTDRIRDTSAMIDRRVTLRFSADLVINQWELVLAAVRQAMEDGLHQIGAESVASTGRDRDVPSRARVIPAQARPQPPIRPVEATGSRSPARRIVAARAGL